MNENRQGVSPACRHGSEPTTKDRDTIAATAEFRLHKGHWPTPGSADKVEAKLGVWLHRQRTRLAQGVMDEFRLAALDDALPGWKITPGESWLESGRSLSNFLLVHGCRPQAWAEDNNEHLSGLWLDVQINLSRGGILPPKSHSWLNEHCPQWDAKTYETRASG